jgi:hypothetical protein
MYLILRVRKGHPSVWIHFHRLLPETFVYLTGDDFECDSFLELVAEQNTMADVFSSYIHNRFCIPFQGSIS